jgi:hypothetical protein
VTWFEGSQVWGDSIRVRSHRRSLDTVFVRGSAFAAQRDTTLDRIQQLTGRDLTAFFRSDSLRRIVAQPNAQAIRFLSKEDGSLQGAAQASADSIVLRFRDGAMKRTSIKGGVQSTYYRSPETIPDPFELPGFQWTPDRTPTKAGLLRAPRVRDRLDLRPGPPRPPLARRARPPPDTSAATEGAPPRGAAWLRSAPRPVGALPPVPADAPPAPPDTTRGPGPAAPVPDTSQTPPPRP